MIKEVLLFGFVLLVMAGCKLNNDNPADPGTNAPDPVLMPDEVQNGNFEITNDNKLPSYWTLNIAGTPGFDFFKLDSTEIESGTKSLNVNYIDSLAHPDPVNGSWGGIYQTIPINDFTVGNRYYLKFWVKSNIGKIQVRLVKNGNMEYPLLSYIVPTDPTWREYNLAFTIDQTTSYMWLVINTKPALASDGLVTAWIDNIRFFKQ